jgi:hypothetical protein
MLKVNIVDCYYLCAHVVKASQAVCGSNSANRAKRPPLQIVQQLAEHSSITTTRKNYLAVRSEDLALASDAVNIIMARVL